MYAKSCIFPCNFDLFISCVNSCLPPVFISVKLIVRRTKNLSLADLLSQPRLPLPPTRFINMPPEFRVLPLFPAIPFHS